MGPICKYFALPVGKFHQNRWNLINHYRRVQGWPICNSNVSQIYTQPKLCKNKHLMLQGCTFWLHCGEKVAQFQLNDKVARGFTFAWGTFFDADTFAFLCVLITRGKKLSCNIERKHKHLTFYVNFNWNIKKKLIFCYGLMYWRFDPEFGPFSRLMILLSLSNNYKSFLPAFRFGIWTIPSVKDPTTAIIDWHFGWRLGEVVTCTFQ